MLAHLLTGLLTFTATNVDDIFILMLFFSQMNATHRARHIVAGQYLGFAALVGVSFVGFAGGRMVPEHWIGFLGLLPIVLGIRKLLGDEAPASPVAEIPIPSARWSRLLSPQVGGVAAVTFANGGDNLGIYIPLFASSSPARLGAVLVVFFILVGVWCYLGFTLARQGFIAAGLARYGARIFPWVLIGLGFYIFWESGTLGWLGSLGRGGM